MAIPVLVLTVAFYAAVATGYAEARRRREAPPRWVRIAGPVAVLAHLVGLLALSMEMGRSPFATGSQSLSFMAFSLAALYLLLEATSRVATHGGWFHAAAAVLAAFAVPGLVESSVGELPTSPKDAALSMHIGLSLLSTSAVLASSLLAMGYLGAYARLKKRKLREGAEGPSLRGFGRLTRRAALAAVLLLCPALVYGIRLAMRDEQPPGVAYLVAATGALLLLLAVASLIWWRRPLRGALAAWLIVAGLGVLIVAFGLVHPLVFGSAW
jgi:ABC-type transport system involved in cytochrome c biogenesis permease subunit